MSLHLNPEGLAQGMSYNALASEPSRDHCGHMWYPIPTSITLPFCVALLPLFSCQLLTWLWLCLLHRYAVVGTAHA